MYRSYQQRNKCDISSKFHWQIICFGFLMSYCLFQTSKLSKKHPYPGLLRLLCFALGFSDLSVKGAVTAFHKNGVKSTKARPLKEKITAFFFLFFFAVLLVDQIYSDFKLNLSLKNLVKEGNHFTTIWYRWVNRFWSNLCSQLGTTWHCVMLTLCPCLLVLVLSPLCVTHALVCASMIHECVTHECISPCVCVALTPSWWMYPCVCLCVCACPSHPSRAIHLYLSETSIEIDSSDGMISEASTKDPSSSEEEGPSSDDDDDGDDSDWGGGDTPRRRKHWCEASQEALMEGRPSGICRTQRSAE